MANRSLPGTSEHVARGGPAFVPGLPSVALVLWAEAGIRTLARELAEARIAVLLLKGPPLQARLYGTPAAYRSGDVDVLVPRGGAREAMGALQRAGWTFERGNGALWFLSRAATYNRDGLRVDLHWGLHAAHLPAWTLRPLERALWRGATPGPGGLLEPDAESLLVFLAVHVVGHRFERPEWAENVAACARLVTDWANVGRIAREARVEGAVRAALDGHPGRSPVVLDGVLGRAVWTGTWLLRGHFIPRGLRDRVREAVALRREGFGVGGFPRTRERSFAGLDLRVGPGVFPPAPVTEGLVRLALDRLRDRSRAVAVEVGTGSGAVALAVASARSDAEVHATDISGRALRWARRNRRRLGIANVRFHRGSLLQPLPGQLRGRVSVVMSNAPYVPPVTAAKREWDAPLGTVRGPGSDGLDLLRTLAREAREFLERGGWLVIQTARYQWDGFAEELRALGYRPEEPELRGPGAALVGAAKWDGHP
jgi:HemK-like putative methylase